ncbi:histone-lysine N-methyltransferase NSD2 isoform X2 [Culex quinquefasciatus]|nr:histone-lysine N-methyltransferase NSD2 isoform X2 [Culex quinquefasciatus]
MYVNIKSSAARDEEDSICEGKLLDKDPCGLHSNCINRALLLECNLKTCPAGEIHQNQCFKRK